MRGGVFVAEKGEVGCLGLEFEKIEFRGRRGGCWGRQGWCWRVDEVEGWLDTM